jgi:predicted outer membrane repeat protein
VASPTTSDPNDGFGGALLVDSGGTLTVSDSTLSGNSAFNGGAISASGTVIVNNSTLSGNSARNVGGAVLNHGTISTRGAGMNSEYGSMR